MLNKMYQTPIIKIKKKIQDEFVKKYLEGAFLEDNSYDTVIDESTIFRDADTGNLIGIFLKDCIPDELADTGYKSLKVFAKPDNNRGIASGKIRRDLIRKDHQRLDIEVSPDGFRYRPILPNGTRSRNTYSNMSNGGIFGFFESTPRFPYCRQTAITLQHPHYYADAIPYIQHINDLFEQFVPDRYAIQKAEVEKTDPAFVIHKTAFSTLTINKNFATAVHTDKGDLEEGFSCLAVPKSFGYTGGYTCITSYRVAFDVRATDLLLMNAHNWHHNSPIKPSNEHKDDFERLVCVLYYRTKMVSCAPEKDELARARKKSESKAQKDLTL